MNELIQWPRAKYWDRAWNPIVGCKPCSPACDHCYAREWARRFHKRFNPLPTFANPPRSSVVFCGNMTDLFGEWLDGDLIPGTYKWLVVGCESGPNRRPCKIEWVEDIVAKCRAANVPVFVKQLDIGGKCETDIAKFPAHLQIRQVPWMKGGAA